MNRTCLEFSGEIFKWYAVCLEQILHKRKGKNEFYVAHFRSSIEGFLCITKRKKRKKK